MEQICRVQKQKRKRRPWTTPWTCGGSIPPLGSIWSALGGEWKCSESNWQTIALDSDDRAVGHSYAIRGRMRLPVAPPERDRPAESLTKPAAYRGEPGTCRPAGARAGGGKTKYPSRDENKGDVTLNSGKALLCVFSKRHSPKSSHMKGIQGSISLQ